MKMKVTVTFEYEPNPLHYPTPTADAMAALDKSNFEDPLTLADEISMVEYTVVVEPQA